MSTTPACRHCHAPIEFVHDHRGRRLALDPGHHDDGTIDIDADGYAHTATARAYLDPAWPLRRLHRRSCSARDRRRGHDHTERSN